MPHYWILRLFSKKLKIFTYTVTPWHSEFVFSLLRKFCIFVSGYTGFSTVFCFIPSIEVFVWLLYNFGSIHVSFLITNFFCLFTFYPTISKVNKSYYYYYFGGISNQIKVYFGNSTQ